MNAEPARCSEVLARLWEFIDGELDSPHDARIRAHLEKCQACYPHYDFQKAYRGLLAACAGEQCPAALRRKIFLLLLEEDRVE